ncbi:MAG TPA: hypothetical protein PKD58_09930, partial [Candidatus Sumerlaeota bacterium]|nr:hypothetical protein [Candidatus Sumerlaeota bacterium]
MRCFPFILLALIFLSACDNRLPVDPKARHAEVSRRIEKARTSHEAMAWLSQIADDGLPETRDLMLSFITGPSGFRAEGTINLINRDVWLKDEVVRQRLRDYYLDAMGSYRRRAHIRFAIIKPNETKYPEFANLPDEVPVP